MSRYLKANDAMRLDYISYLGCFYDFSKVSQSVKLQYKDGYGAYLKDLLEYLTSFYRKIQPLVDVDEMIKDVEDNFEKLLVKNKCWSFKENGKHFCKACRQGFASIGVYNGHLKGKKHKRNEKLNGGDDQVEDYAMMEGKKLAMLEHKISKLCELLREVLEATKNYLELKQTRTHQEVQAEIAEEEAGYLEDITINDGTALDDDDDDDAPLHNPLNLPLGWDGKPIPFWLYRLHGLGEEFKCEICGNHSYWGRRAFDRHFQEWRHAHGMKCLKVPNTKHFHDITLIEDAIHCTCTKHTFNFMILYK